MRCKMADKDKKEKEIFEIMKNNEISLNPIAKREIKIVTKKILKTTVFLLSMPKNGYFLLFKSLGKKKRAVSSKSSHENLFLYSSFFFIILQALKQSSSYY